jgi:indolepyruvate ferredoxin oxidoreductase beta subunit
MNILVAGVGGQGVILFSNIIADLALTAGLDVKKSEVHGMAQRGGSVVSHIRYGSRVFSPLTEEGRADIIVAFEKVEALRYIHYLGPNGRLVYDSHRIDPLPVSIGTAERPGDPGLDERIAARAHAHTHVPAFETAVRLGNPRVQNVVMLGAVAQFLEFPPDAFRAAIAAGVKKSVVELNLKAFDEGRRLSGQAG